jgi:hypothetical protein
LYYCLFFDLRLLIALWYLSYYKKWELIYLSQAPEFTPIIWWEPMLLIVVFFVLSHYVSLRGQIDKQ